LDDAEARELLDTIQDARAMLDELMKEVRAIKRKLREVEVAVKELGK